MSTRTVEVCNLSLGANRSDIREFFSFSGDIESIVLKSVNERTQIAYVTFTDSQGAETAVLLSGATIVDTTVNISLAPDYEPPQVLEGSASTGRGKADDTAPPETTLQRAEDVVTSVLARGFILGKDAVGKVRAFDERHGLTSTASAKVNSIDKKIGLVDKISAGTTIVGDKVKEMDNKFQVSEKTRSAFTTTEQKVSDAGSSVMKNKYVFAGLSLVAGAVGKFARTAGGVGQKTAQKVSQAEDQRKTAVPPTTSSPPAPPQSGGLIL